MTEPNDDDLWRRVRDQFRLDRSMVFLNAMVTASNPDPVREAIDRHRQAIDADPIGYLWNNRRMVTLIDHTAERAAAYLDLANTSTAPDVIALTMNTTAGLGQLYNGLVLERGAEVLLPISSPFTKAALDLRLAKALPPIKVTQFSLFADSLRATDDEMVRSIEQNIKDVTRVLALTWVLSDCGVKLPLPRIGELVSDINSERESSWKKPLLICVDGVHGFGVENLSFDQMGCDFFVAGCHKWIFGPRGTGIICGRQEAWRSVIPSIPSGRPGPTGKGHTPNGVLNFEHQFAVADAFDFHLKIGKDKIQSRTHELATQLKNGLDGIAKVILHTPMDPAFSSGIVCCSVTGVDADDAEKTLKEYGIMASVAYARPDSPRLLRFSPCIFNTPDEIDCAIAAVNSL